MHECVLFKTKDIDYEPIESSCFLRNIDKIELEKSSIGLLNENNLLRFQTWLLKTWHVAPKHEVNNDLSVYFHIEEEISKISSPSNIRYYNVFKKLSVFRILQGKLLSIIYKIRCGVGLIKTNRNHSYYDNKPKFYSNPIFCYDEKTFFAAQAIVNKFKLRDFDEYPEDLFINATKLLAAYGSLRYCFRNRAMEYPEPPYYNLCNIMHEFEKAWVVFEHGLFRLINNQNNCFYLTNKYKKLTALSKKITQNLLHLNLLNVNQIEELDPKMIIMLPRATLFNILTAQYTTETTKELLSIYKSPFDIGNLIILKSAVSSLKLEEKVLLSKKLLNSDIESPLLAEKLADIFKEVCTYADKLYTGRLCKEYTLCVLRNIKM